LAGQIGRSGACPKSLIPTLVLLLAAGSGKLSLDFLHRSLTANVAYTNNTATQNWFTTAGSATVAAATAYRMRGQFRMTNGTVSHSVAFIFGGTATLTSIAYFSIASSGPVNTADANQSSKMVDTAASTNVITTVTTAGTQVFIDGIVRINAGGTFIPQFAFSAAPGAGSLLAGTFFELVPIGSNTVTQVGAWS
jgi:hypothetical protein